MAKKGPIAPGLPTAGQVLFAGCFLVFVLFLVATFPSQTTWVKKTRLFAQPGFWPAVSVGGMALFGGLHLWRLRPLRHGAEDWAEFLVWARALEFAVWFLIYVWLVPLIGYVVASVLFVPALALRMGYRGGFWIGLSVLFGVAVVVLFKSWLQVKIPGGALYEYLPDALRGFFILNL